MCGWTGDGLRWQSDIVRCLSEMLETNNSGSAGMLCFPVNTTPSCRTIQATARVHRTDIVWSC